ncbi:serine/threonine-protein kinase [Streptomyces sp. NBC_01408]|uniref:serine/threonine-protein kinase n=1 Tax=Streptomyces sp. NBC_01408 TaxID=2903855 RepID=UPI002254E519|nr:serine/threonine-protein kinase [Streptomyces sp. NBC_01408]MCX4695395.1 serine/threonine protein kinase [Streptomyces sp. NBC_01408]
MSGAPSGEPFQPLGDDDPAVVGGYRLAAVLGAGGMGKVYLSFTPGGRPVALKVIRSEFSQDPEFRRRFQREVQSAQRVQGLYTAPVIDFDTDGARPWLATAYVPGPSLAEAVSTYGALPLRSVLLLTVGAAEALHVIHAAGIVHRDLKPANVLLAPDGPRVIDFGIARAADNTALTGTGVSVGTPSFMAPEQAAGGTVTPATDIFALGQIAAYAAIGAPAYGGGPSHAVLYRIVHEEPDLSRLPSELRPLVARCLSREPAERPALTEVIDLCHGLSTDPLRQGGDWLPQTLAGSLTARQHLPEPVRTPPPALPTPTAYSPQPPPPGGVDPYAPTGFGPASAPTQTAPGRPGTAPAGPGFPPAPPPVVSGQQNWAPPPPPRRKKNRGLVIAGAVAAAVIGLAVINALLPDGSGKDGSGKDNAKQPTAGSSGGASGGKRPDPQPAEYKGIDLTENYFVMLADNPPRPTSKDGNPGFSSKGDVFYQPRVLNVVERDEIGTGNGKLVLLQSGQQGSLDTCRSETRYSESIRLDQLSDGSQLCVLSDAGHIAVATYRGKSGANDPSKYITLDLTIWRNAEDPQKKG